MGGSLIVLGIFASFLIAGLWGDDVSDDGDATPDPDPMPEPEPEPDDDAFLVGGGEPLVGTPAGDLFQFDLTETGFDGVSLAAGGGDDILDLVVPTDDDSDLVYLLTNATIDGGPGNDLVDVSSEGNTITGGDGSDMITSYFGASTSVFGGEGDDILSAFQQDSGGVALFGGAGDDVLDGTQMENGVLSGDEGNDLLSVVGGRDGGAGYVVQVLGGAGEDTIEYSGGGLTNGLGPLGLSGGADADTFALTLNEGALDFIGPGGAVLDFSQPDGSDRLAAVDIRDFSPGEDVLVVEASTLNDTFELTTARLETVDGAGGVSETQMILRCESPDEAAREVVVSFGASAVTWDDITFVGDEIPAVIAV